MAGLFALIIRRYLGISQEFSRLYILCCAIPNANSFPFPIIEMIGQEYLTTVRSDAVTLGLGYQNIYVGFTHFLLWSVFVPYLDGTPKKPSLLQTPSTENLLVHEPVALEKNIQVEDTFQPSPWYKRIYDTLKTKTPTPIKAFFTSLPFLSAVISTLIACIQPLQSALFQQNAPLSFLINIATRIAAGTVGLLFIVGGYGLSTGYSLQSFKCHWKAIVAVSFIRLILMAFLGLAIIYLLAQANLFGLKSNPIMRFIILISI